MEEIQTWRDLLGRVISNPQERQRIADALGVNPITLSRWATHKSNPRPDNLRPLLEALPDHKASFATLIAQEFPHFSGEETSGEEASGEIAPAFYKRILSMHTTTPVRLRAATMQASILQHIVNRFDPERQGFLALLAQCVPPGPGQKVRSLRMTMAKGTLPWSGSIENRTYFYGAESQTGQAILGAQPVVINTSASRTRLFECTANLEQSAAALPIRRSERSAGCLSLASTQPYYFTHEIMESLQAYTDLLVLAFENDEFYDLQDIELGMMPGNEAQLSGLITFQQRVTQHLIKAAQRNETLTRPEAERYIWKELEEEFLRVAEQ